MKVFLITFVIVFASSFLPPILPLEPVSQGEYQFITSSWNDNCLTSDSPVRLAECNYSSHKQMWRFIKYRGYYVLKNAWNNECLSINHREQPVTLRCRYRSNQRFEKVDSPLDDTYQLKVESKELCLDVKNWGQTELQFFTCHIGPNQQFK